MDGENIPSTSQYLACPSLPATCITDGPYQHTASKSRLGYKCSAAAWTAILHQESKLSEKPSADTENNLDCNLSSLSYDQGNHEVAVEVEGSLALVKWAKCQKHVGHYHFIRAQNFCMHHLPVRYQDEDIFMYIKLWSQLSVKVTVNRISSKRPEGYAFYSLRGKNIPLTGGGKVADIKTESSPCPCLECFQSDTPKMVWKAIWIMTAMHVVFNDSEAKQAIVELFYDDADNTEDVRKMTGVRVVDCNFIGDWCKFECATHDLEFAHKLEEIDARVLQLGMIIKDKDRVENFGPLAVIASHPHGCSKHITIGEWKDRKFVKNIDKYEWTEYSYTTSTCVGCSGAPVWIIGPQRNHYSYNYYSHVHSEALKSGLSKSGAGDVDKCWDEDS